MVKRKIEDTEDVAESESGSEASHSTKKQKAKMLKKAKEAVKKGKGKVTASASNTRDTFVSLGPSRRATIHKYGGKVLVDIREFYTDKNDDIEKPGKKGISLTTEQWTVLKSNVSHIDKLISDLESN